MIGLTIARGPQHLDDADVALTDACRALAAAQDVEWVSASATRFRAALLEAERAIGGVRVRVAGTRPVVTTLVRVVELGDGRPVALDVRGAGGW